MTQYDYDLFVIGAGSGGVRTARIAAGHGARVAIAEDRYLGGTCVNVGCVPKKLFVYASQFKDSFEGAAGFGWSVAPASFDWRKLVSNKNQEIERLNGVYQRLLDNSGATIINGRATLVDEHTVQVGEQRYTAQRILIATGGWPYIPEVYGKEHIISSNEIFFLEQLPQRIVIVGGGYIAVEFAGILHGLGVKVTLCERGERLLHTFDEDVSQFLAQEMAKKGIEVLFHTRVDSIRQHGESYTVILGNGNELETDLVMYATGRKPNSHGLGLEQLGVKLDHNGAVRVNDDYQTNVPSIYALGDVTNRVNLTPVATAEGMVLANKLFGGKDGHVDYVNIPTAVFSQPNIGTVGTTEHEARRLHGEDIDVYKTTFRPMKNTISGSEERTLMKMVVQRSTDKVLGMHMVGPDAGEIIQGMAVAIRAGATKAVFDSTIGIHPTAAEEFVTLRTPV